jgi:hypothetical protein
LPCLALPYRASLRFALLSFALPCLALPYRASLRFALLSFALPYFALFCFALLYVIYQQDGNNV